MNKEKIKELVFILGLGFMSAYYALTCVTFILAFFTNSSQVIIHLNIFGELNTEFVMTVISLPFAGYTILEIMRLKKAEMKVVV